MTVTDGNTGNPFGNNAEICVEFSDAALLAASVIGFLILASTVSSTVTMHLTSSKAVEKEDLTGGNGDEEQLMHADVSTLDRSQRELIKVESADAELEIQTDAKGSEVGNAKGSVDGVTLSLQEVQRAAKAKEKLIRAARAAERDALRVLEDDRREQEKQAQDEAQKQKRKEEREEAQKQEAARLVEEKQKEELEKAKFEASKVFLSSPSKSESVQEWIDEMKVTRTVLMTDMATSFKLPEEKVVQRIQELSKEGRVAGVMDENGRFIFIAEDELHSIAESLIERGLLSLTDAAALCNERLGKVRGD
jgi:hypothetical protein